jgi:demethylmacrocin O-methyltransferase
MQPVSKRFRAMALAAPIVAILPLGLKRILRFARSDKEGEHSYGAAYDRFFRRLKYKRITLLEIGIGGYDHYSGGSSLAAWQWYFPFGKIIGCDIHDKRELARGRIRVHVIDQSSSTDLVDLSAQEGPFDIIIDDGSHVNSHQIFTFQHLIDSLKPGGIYVIEDTQTSYWPEYGGKPPIEQSRETAVGYFSELANYLNYREFKSPADEAFVDIARSFESIYFEHNLIVLTKRS